jgi:hypothetical protein
MLEPQSKGSGHTPQCSVHSLLNAEDPMPGKQDKTTYSVLFFTIERVI